MITEDYVSFETAKLLKEKGFDEATLGYYLDDKDKLYFDRFSDDWNSNHVGYISAPTLQMAMKWLREVHNLHIEVFITTNHLMFQWKIYRTENTSLYFAGTSLSYYEKYEEACEAGINYCLRNLI